MLDDVLWEKKERHLHVFIPIKWCILDVRGKMCSLRTDCDVPKKFREKHVSGAHSEFKRIIDHITANNLQEQMERLARETA